MSPERIKDWLARNGRDRVWLAQYCRVSKTTVDGWLSGGRTIPGPAQKLLEGLIATSGPNLGGFDVDQILKWDNARRAAGYSSLHEFLKDVLETKADEILLQEEADRDPGL